MKQDLEAAASFQKTLLPSADHVTRNLQISWAYRPCDELAGDSLNFVRLDDYRTAVFVFDVAGHGVRASLLSVAVTHALLPNSDGSTLLFQSDQSSAARSIASPAAVAGRLNTYFELSDSNSRFFTLVFGIIDTRDESFTYVNAGHPSPLLARRNDSIEALDSTGPPIGPIPAYPFTERRTGMGSGDRLLLYTDGLPDEMNDSDERFGVERIKELLRKSWDVPLPQLVDRLEREVVTWSETGSLNDDLSILAVERVENCNRNR
jgi:sigma-B regulation protein RsbU (phosphoserine phosphatase)